MFVSIIAISTVSYVSANDLDNYTLKYDDVNPIMDDITYVGGECDFQNQAPLESSSSIEPMVDETKQNHIQAKIELKESGSYYDDKTLNIKVIDPETNSPLSGVPVTLKFTSKKIVTVITKSNGEVDYNIPFKPGKYKVTASISSNFIKSYSSNLKSIKIKKAPAKITLKKLKTSYRAKKYFEIKVTNTKNKKGIGNVKLLLKVYTNGKAKRGYVTTNSKGVAKYKTNSLTVGSHKVQVREVSSGISAKAKTSKIKVGKARTTFLDELDQTYIKKAKTYDVALFNKNNVKSIKGVKLIVKINVGKKWISHIVKTGKYGVRIDISYLGLGSYKTKVFFEGNSRYKKCSGKGQIDILKDSGSVIFGW